MRPHLDVGRLMRAIGRQIRRASIFALAAKSPGLRFDIALTYQRIIRKGKFDRLQAFQFVAIARGLLEFEIGGGLPQAFIKISDCHLEIMPCQTLRRGETGIDRDMVLLIDRA